MKAVIPAAGLGTRFLPATKSQPKEMLPVVDQPVIQYVVEEAVRSGIDDIIIITGRGKRAIEDHFDKSFELEEMLRANNKLDALNDMVRISSLADIHYIRQKEPRGLGDAVHRAKRHIGDEAFAVLLGDDIVIHEVPCIRQLRDVFERYNEPVLAVQNVSREKICLYGAIEAERVEDALYKITNIVEKPTSREAPSTLATMGRYILTPEIFECIEQTARDAGNELQLSDALNLLLRKRTLYGYEFKGRRYDIGNKVEWIKATVELALEREELAGELRNYLKSIDI